MKHIKLVSTLLALAAFALGRKPSEEKSAAENREATAAQFDKVKKETNEAAQDTNDYAYRKRLNLSKKCRTS